MSELKDKDSLKFILLQTNLSGNVAVVKDGENVGVIPSLLPNKVPSLLSTFEEEVEKNMLTSPEWLDLNNRKHANPLFPRQANLSEIYSTSLCSLQCSLQVGRNPTSGELLDFYEEMIDDGLNLTSKNSCSLLRSPGLPNEALRGTSTSYPFWPGGIESVDEMLIDKTDNVIDFEENLQTCPPGFTVGIDFDKHFKSAMFNVDNIFSDCDNDKLEETGQKVTVQTNLPKDKTDHEIMDLLPEQSEIVVEKEKVEIKTILDGMWAEKVDISKKINDFQQRLPNIAHKFPFELDTFQKQAILKLEDHQSVFIAAHTSAGKTVVAEYAIALSAKNMTRVIYTSPIKALSNQKYCDFKHTFKDVGLITGDVQINPDAFCLIMTTEILRSMLYNGSDVIRDLEWVIFDEVHYINDLERGVVWEEVLIMLPDHCNIILLSATVPNTMEFANWIGRTKKKKIYVISTLKRPVPLEHHLYTGNSSKTSKELFLLIDADRKFLPLGYKKALTAKNERQSKHGRTFGAKVQHGGNPIADKGIWLSLINRLQKEDQLPIVAFTFSRRRCNENAVTLESLDLTTATEKSEIHIFFNKCIQKLKGTDSKLPQVLQISQLLSRGLGVHHSGILPILKEVVEMLFSRGLVKLLFATETFAMGVNMPARTVVFDSLRKHDGTRMRNLLPGEYIQMAGRAGRRGLDPIGTVILLCKGDVPEMSELHLMMLGKPTKLESQFRLTYGMILNLLRVEQLRVEEVMKHSFSEFNARKNSKAQEQKLKELHAKIETQSEVQELIAHSDYQHYLESCQELLSLRSEVQELSLMSNSGIKIMQPGRVVVLDCEKYKLCVAITLKVNTSKAQNTFTVLVLCGEKELKTDKSIWDPSIILGKKLFCPEKVKHDLIEVEPKEIAYVTTKTLRINAQNIMADFKKRQQPRFSNDLPLQCTSVATQELMRLVESNEDGLPPIDIFSVLGLNEIEIVEMLTKVKSLEESIRYAFTCPTLPRFKSEILVVETYLKLEKDYDELKYLLSEASLHLLPEYEQRVQVLKHLKYIDSSGAVQLKGRVACEISSHEIVLTELVFENVFSAMDPSEIVALLSCAVFQQRVDLEEVNFTVKLKEGMKKIIDIATGVGQVQYDFGIRMPVNDFVSTLKFGLVEVVYEWTKGTSFKDITGLTSIQEGVIVRTIQRLNETCRDVRNAAKVIGDPTLHAKMEKCSELIKRDIVFAASLYIQ